MVSDYPSFSAAARTVVWLADFPVPDCIAQRYVGRSFFGIPRNPRALGVVILTLTLFLRAAFFSALYCRFAAIFTFRSKHTAP